jgi:hypothetical protein
MVPRRLAVWLVAGLVACSGHDTTAPEGPGELGKFDKVWHDFDAHYAFFEYGSIDWAAIGDRYRARVTSGMGDAALARVIGDMVGELRDHHADLTTPFGVYGAPPIPYAHHFAPAVVQAHYFAAPLRATPSGRIQFTRLLDGTGYVYIGSFQGQGWGNEISDALAGLAGVPALIVDIRDNTGGDEAIGQQVASRFYDMPRIYRQSRYRDGPGHGDFGPITTMTASPSGERFRGPVALITNRWNGSAAEDFTLMMRVLPTVATVGDTTLGLGSNPLPASLSNGWTYRIPQSMQSTPDGFVYQWRGLPPAIAVQWSDADVAAGVDSYLDAALRELARRLAQ